jgi:hypothetical protein
MYPTETREIPYGPFSTKSEQFNERFDEQEQRNKERPKNYSEWGPEQDQVWRDKPIEEVERYYLNLQGYIKKLNSEAENEGKAKPYALIKKKKLWRNGLRLILSEHPVMRKHYVSSAVEKKNKRQSAGGIGPKPQPTYVNVDANSRAPRAIQAMPDRPAIAEVKRVLEASRKQRAQVAEDKKIPSPDSTSTPTSQLICEEELEDTDHYSFNENGV